MQHLILNLEAPLMAFGGETIDNLGVIRRFPAVSMLTGLFANALGWRRIERDKHQLLQDRIVFAARIDREPAGGLRMTDFQTAQLNSNDRAWTTRGVPEGRAGGANTYNAPHLRYRDYFADMRVTVAIRLSPADEAPTLDDLQSALDEPARPLFIGRKPCLPSGPLCLGMRDADSALDALIDTPLHTEAISDNVVVHMLWPEGEGESAKWDIQSRPYMITDERNWRSGLHGGGRLVHEGTLPSEYFSKEEGTQEEAE